MIKINDNMRIVLSSKVSQISRCAIYGIGKGTTKILNAMQELKIDKSVKYIIANEKEVQNNSSFCGYEVVTMKELPNNITHIIVGAELSHRMIYDRINHFLHEEHKEGIEVINPFAIEYDVDNIQRYVDYLHSDLKDALYCDISENNYVRSDSDSKIIAWFLPQFHRIELNDQYHGKGFTEWTNTSRTLPQFCGHYQPHIPYDVGYYDLLNKDTLKRQAELALKYGVYGFGFFYYWFSGKRIMEQPINLLIDNKDININFCLHWATDDWSMSWYGGENKVILKQEIPNSELFWDDISIYFKDNRYIKINNKPLLIIYKCEMFGMKPFKQFIDEIRNRAIQAGYAGLYIMISTGAGEFRNAYEWGADALVEYQPWQLYKNGTIENLIPEGYINPQFKGYISDISYALEKKEYLDVYTNEKLFRSAMVSWDNSARKKNTNAIVMLGNSPTKMKEWLIDIMRESKVKHSQNEDIVFISSWNEWAEGSHLEPDYRYGYAWLNAVKEALLVCRKD